MQKNKYYTPEIEEFHVGFEYEQASTMPSYLHWDFIVWGDDINDEFEFLISGIRDEHVRVKYLTKEDIEWLNWKYISTTTKASGSKILKFSKENLRMTYELSSMEMCIYVLLDPVAAKNIYVLPTKNKSELVRVMKTLNIK